MGNKASKNKKKSKNGKELYQVTNLSPPWPAKHQKIDLVHYAKLFDKKSQSDDYRLDLQVMDFCVVYNQHELMEFLCTQELCETNLWTREKFMAKAYRNWSRSL